MISNLIVPYYLSSPKKDIQSNLIIQNIEEEKNNNKNNKKYTEDKNNKYTKDTKDKEITTLKFNGNKK